MATAHPRTERAPAASGQAGPGRAALDLIPGLDATDPREPAFTTEPSAPSCPRPRLGSDDPVEFLDRAVDFANNRLWGTLSADLVIHPKAMKDPPDRGGGRAGDRAAPLRRGHGKQLERDSSFAYGTPPWGAYPGSTPANIQSGTGWVHNTLMLEGIEKAVLRHPITRCRSRRPSRAPHGADTVPPAHGARGEGKLVTGAGCGGGGDAGLRRGSGFRDRSKRARSAQRAKVPIPEPWTLDAERGEANARGGDRTHMGIAPLGILSPMRLPVSPPERRVSK